MRNWQSCCSADVQKPSVIWVQQWSTADSTLLLFADLEFRQKNKKYPWIVKLEAPPLNPQKMHMPKYWQSPHAQGSMSGNQEYIYSICVNLYMHQ